MYKYIQAMSMDQKLAQDKILNALDNLTEHLIKLYVYPNTNYVNHWRKEVWNALKRVPKLKANNKFPSPDWIYDILSSYLDMTEDILWQIVDDYSAHTPTRLDPDELRIKLDDYYHWLADKLFTKGLLKASEVYEELGKLEL